MQKELVFKPNFKYFQPGAHKKWRSFLELDRSRVGNTKSWKITKSDLIFQTLTDFSACYSEAR